MFRSLTWSPSGRYEPDYNQNYEHVRTIPSLTIIRI